MKKVEKTESGVQKIIKKSNKLILSFGKNSLIANKIFLTALLYLQDRDGCPESEREYYTMLERTTYVDFTRGLVAEISTSDFKKAIGSNAGSYYQIIEQMMENVPTPSSSGRKSIKGMYTLMTRDYANDIWGVTQIIASTAYDGKRGKIFIKFINERAIRKELIDLQNSYYTKLDYNLMMSYKSVYSYKLYEMLVCQIGSESGKYKVSKSVYSFTFGLSELKYYLGILDPYINNAVQAELTRKNPDYEKAELMTPDKDRHKSDFNKFKTTVLEVAKKEINEKSNYEIDYEMIRGGYGGKVKLIVFHIQKKEQLIPAEHLSEEEKDKFIDDISDLIPVSLKVKDLRKIAEASGYQMEKVKKAVTVLLQSKDVNNTMGLLICAIRNNYEPGIPYNKFNQFEQNDYNFDDLEKDILANASPSQPTNDALARKIKII